MRKFLAVMVGLLALVAIGPQVAAAKEKPGGNLLGLYNKRYCEVFAVTQPSPPNFSIDIYNTVGLNDCPSDQWNALDYGVIKSETNSLVAVPNGPRRWVIDAIVGGRAGTPVTLSGLEMRYVAVLEVPSLNPPPYGEMSIARTTTWVYKKGRSLHFLVSPEGRRYALQAFTTNLDPSLRARNLNRLGRNASMDLPEGWNYRTIKLKKQLRLKAPGVATIMRDPLGGTYQRFAWPKNFFKPVKKPKRGKRR